MPVTNKIFIVSLIKFCLKKFNLNAKINIMIKIILFNKIFSGKKNSIQEK